MEIRKHIVPNKYETERCVINKEWWYVRSLEEAAKEKGLEVFDLDLASIDLGVMPWDMKSIYHFIDHCNDVEKCEMNYPVVMSPSGWIMNGWHRVVKGIIQGRKTIKAVRFFDLPSPDGVYGKDD